MKQYIYKNIVGENPRQKEISIEERENRLNVSIFRKRSSKFFVRAEYCARSIKDLEIWLVVHQNDGKRWRDCHVMRSINTETGEVTLTCKVIGEFFLVQGMTVYKIVYVNSIKFNISANKRVKTI